ncbi:MAG: hypothetical protein EPO26_00250 [Chloroflexota bacterium]|nr:MAG: hypothetical protein EPO26_00250 [Chloroflexota bacterium]
MWTTQSAELDRHLPSIVASVLAERRQDIDAWLANRPGAWGALAGQAVLSARRALSRPLTDAERRAVWAAMWEALAGCRQGEGGEPLAKGPIESRSDELIETGN